MVLAVIAFIDAVWVMQEAMKGMGLALAHLLTDFEGYANA